MVIFNSYLSLPHVTIQSQEITHHSNHRRCDVAGLRLHQTGCTGRWGGCRNKLGLNRAYTQMYPYVYIYIYIHVTHTHRYIFIYIHMTYMLYFTHTYIYIYNTLITHTYIYIHTFKFMYMYYNNQYNVHNIHIYKYMAICNVVQYGSICALRWVY